MTTVGVFQTAARYEARLLKSHASFQVDNKTFNKTLQINFKHEKKYNNLTFEYIYKHCLQLTRCIDNCDPEFPQKQ